jgi:3-hydroxyisobutyrate dehydrogenase
MKIGYIGLGRMGLPMAERLIAAGHTLTVFNRSQAAVQRLVAQGAQAGASPQDVASKVEVLFTCLLTPAQCEEIFLGEKGAVHGARAGQIFVDMATIEPMTTRRLGASLAEKGVVLLDAPISGGPNGAAAGTLSIMVGGESAAFEKVKPLLDVLGKKIFHMGPVGCGVSAKICNQILTGTTHALVAEAMVLGTKLGLDPQRLFEVLKVSSGQSNSLERAVPNFILPRNFDAAYSVEGIIKDLESAIQAAKASGVRLLLPTIAQQMYQEARGLGHGQKDVAAVVLPMEAIAGVEVKPKRT